MNLLKIQIVLAVFLSVVVSSCKKESDPLVISVTPSGSLLSATSGDVVGFQASCKGDVRLSSFRITVKEQDTYTKTLFDTTLETKSFSYHYEYEVPEFSDSLTEVDIFFTVIDADGNEAKSAKVIYVTTGKYLLLEEFAGLVLYSSYSGKDNACNVNDAGVTNAKNADSSYVDIVDNSSSNTLSRTWYSLSGLKFVSFNSLDYANATMISLENAYESGIKTSVISDMQDEDIYVTKYYLADSSQSYAAIKITLVVDQDSCLTDRYVFSIKK